MIPVAANHAGDVVDRDQLPGFVADVVPARNLFEDEKAHFVAGIEEMTGLWIVRSAYDVAVEAVSQDAGIATLRAAGHGLADEGKRLMAVEAAELDDCAIELEADRKSTRLNSSHLGISYAVFCLKKKKEQKVRNELAKKTTQYVQ